MSGAHWLVTGASGLFGHRAVELLAQRGIPVAGTYFQNAVDLQRVELVPVDLADPRAVRRLVRDLRPAVVIHAAAMTQPAECARHPELSEEINVSAAATLAEEMSALTPASRLFFLSTDLVFDGAAGPYREEDAPKPLSLYGSQKLRAEEVVRRFPGTTVLRTALLFGEPAPHSSGFLGWMLRSLANGEPLTLFADEYRTPLHTDALLDAIVTLAEEDLGRGEILHAGGPERLSRWDLGRQLCEATDMDASLLLPSRLADVSLPVPRPADVSLDSTRLSRMIRFAPVTFSHYLQRAFATHRHEPRISKTP